MSNYLKVTVLIQIKKHDLIAAQSSESDCFPDEKHELTDAQSFKSNCSHFLVDETQSLESENFPSKKHQSTSAQSSQSICSYFPVDVQSLESDCSSPDNKHESTGAQLPESIPSFSHSEKCISADTCPLKNGCSSSSNGNHNLVDTHSHESVSSPTPENLYKSYTQSLRMDCSSFPKRKCNLVGAQFHIVGGSPLNKDHNLSDILSPESDCTSPPESHCRSHSPSPETDFSPPDKTLTPESNCYSPPHRKHKLSYNGFSDNDCPSVPCVKRRLISGRSFKSNLNFSSAESVCGLSCDSDWFPSCLRDSNDELPYDIFLKCTSGCENMLRQIIRTAYQFTRHSHREKLTLKDLERAFKIYNVDIRSDDFDCLVDKIDRDSAGCGDKSQSFTCSGKWLRKLEDILNE